MPTSTIDPNRTQSKFDWLRLVNFFLWEFDCVRLPNLVICSCSIRDRPLEKWWGGGGGGKFSACTESFFSFTACAGSFFSGEPLCTSFFFFQTNIAFFWTVKSWFIISVFVLYKLFYTNNRSKDTGHFNAKSFRKCTHSERGGSHLEWTASLCIFSVPAFWNSSPTAHHNDPRR